MDTQWQGLLHKTMISFTDLLRTDLPPSAEQDHAEKQFPLLTGGSNLHLWRPGDAICSKGRRILIGVATYSLYDMRLLDRVDETLRGLGDQALRVDVFSTLDCKTQEDFNQYVPGIGNVWQTPVVGIWENGRLEETASGAAARRLVAQAGGFDAADIVR